MGRRKLKCEWSVRGRDTTVDGERGSTCTESKEDEDKGYWTQFYVSHVEKPQSNRTSGQTPFSVMNSGEIGSG